MTCPFPRCQVSVTHCDGACHGVMPNGEPMTEAYKESLAKEIHGDAYDESVCYECQAKGPCTGGVLCIVYSH